MTLDECRKYLVPALLGLGMEDLVDNGLKLDNLLGVTWYTDFHYVSRGESSKPLTEEAKTIYRQLAGPHGKTILKAYRIRKGLDAPKENSDNLQDQNHKETSQA